MAIYSARNARRALVDTVAFRAVSQMATIIGFIVLVRAIPEEDFGVLNLLYAFIPVVSLLASLGLEQTLRRYQPEYLNSDNIQAAQWLVRFVASARFGVNIVLLTLILLAWNSVAPIFKLTPYRGEFAFFCLLVLLHFQARILQLSLASHMLHRYSAGSIALLAVVKLTTYSALAWADSLTLLTAIFADTLGFGVAYTLLTFAHKKYCSPRRKPRFNLPKQERNRMLRYGLLNNFNSAGSVMLSAKSDNFFLAALMDPFAVAIYAFYNRLDEMLGQLQPLRLFDTVIQPLFFAVSATEADEKLPRYFSLLLNLSLLPQWPILIFTTVYHAELIYLVFGGKYIDHSVLLPVIIAFTTINSFSIPATIVAQYEERAGMILLSKIFAVYNVAALLILIPMAGVYGAAFATGSAAVMKNLFIWWFARRRARWVSWKSSLLSVVAVWGCVTLVCLGLKSLVSDSPLANVFLGLIVCGIGLIAIVRTPAISRSDRSILANVLKGREARILRTFGVI